MNTRTETSGLWTRAAVMLLFALIWSVTEFVLATVVIVQFLFLLVTKAPNERLLVLGKEVSRYLYEIARFLSFASETRPFPFGDWPGNDRLNAVEDK